MKDDAHVTMTCVNQDTRAAVCAVEECTRRFRMVATVAPLPVLVGLDSRGETDGDQGMCARNLMTVRAVLCVRE
ncbi:hypothetical protein [Paraburkholderia sp. J67]|uniref:hypothetical protein n=1 Tax=Paraburkholderia sp. J67 TaxID=2805435 RepID=UPI002ABDFB6C|nr:hypothetical protein [Paraburkholderia sp. J67]